uniref:Uncharacterized protein n=1 Tax=Rhizophora mucronata TaxID=61149 RepID=A0A2P2N8X3_RHIMU
MRNTSTTILRTDSLCQSLLTSSSTPALQESHS